MEEPRKKIGILVDVQNIYYTTKQGFNQSFNYRKFIKYAQGLGDVVVANAYATERGDDGQHKFQTMLKHIGFNVKLKPFIQRADGSAKGDWDVGITIDAMDIANDIDQLILLSGDGDFDLLLQKLRKDYQVNCQVFGVKRLTAQSLVNSANKYIAIDSDWLL
ncbi:MAG: NYN domain-containing protein [Saccharospirillaceae bacterium]|nr:NYN domain-containing protein [Pseudomonadales bacterium]NRB78932.1 NYN domain-containing protein [Saccharospirillaceae bacterium]